MPWKRAVATGWTFIGNAVALEVYMSGRRRHPRFSVVNAWDGEIRVLRDVVIDRMERDELLAVSHVPAVVGEEMSLDLLTSAGSVELKVKVLESRPVVVAGSMRHSLRLTVADPATEPRCLVASIAQSADV